MLLSGISGKVVSGTSLVIITDTDWDAYPILWFSEQKPNDIILLSSSTVTWMLWKCPAEINTPWTGAEEKHFMDNEIKNPVNS